MMLEIRQEGPEELVSFIFSPVRLGVSSSGGVIAKLSFTSSLTVDIGCYEVILMPYSVFRRYIAGQAQVFGKGGTVTHALLGWAVRGDIFYLEDGDL